MNKFLSYILPFLGALLFACSQQSEESYVQKTDQVEAVSKEKSVAPGATYHWEVSIDEQQDDWEISDIEDEKDKLDLSNSNFNQVAVDEEPQGLVSNGNEVSSGADNKEQSTITPLTKDKVLKAFVKTNMEDVLDLLAIYKASNQDEEMSDVAKMAIEDYLSEIVFTDLETALNSGAGDSKKLKLSTISINEDGDFQGSINVKDLSEKVNIDYIVVSTETEYGTSRKFKVVGVN